MNAKTLGLDTADSLGGVVELLYSLSAEHCLPSDPLLRALDHHLASGGKWSRAQVSLGCSRALGLSSADATVLATVVECLHNASLIQDDLQDRSSLRREQIAVWKAFDDNAAMCLTDLLLSAAYAALCRLQGTDRIIDLLRHTHQSVAETLRGQMQDTSAPVAAERRLEACLQIAQAKSVPFFALALELPLIAAGADTHLATAREAARHFGIGYQIYDDLEDLEQDERENNQHNVVLAFDLGDSPTHPIQLAAQMARSHLATACATAERLPRNCGAVLVHQARKVEKLVLQIAP